MSDLKFSQQWLRIFPSSGVQGRVVRCSPLIACSLLCASFLLGLLFSPEHADMFLRNVSSHLTQYMALYPRRQKSSKADEIIKQG
jgi:hypothetical protein